MGITARDSKQHHIQSGSTQAAESSRKPRGRQRNAERAIIKAVGPTRPAVRGATCETSAAARPPVTPAARLSSQQEIRKCAPPSGKLNPDLASSEGVDPKSKELVRTPALAIAALVPGGLRAAPHFDTPTIACVGAVIFAVQVTQVRRARQT
ncbi:hypothetical protein [Pseudooceanicola sp. LIPI14-2-Ac024]|uniref:hypothetical protein n=1 Tax=Pseudooceanicola sp. LIPI14-2-Ac024 TaxID=3344875 RepID=UPI0035CF9DA0